MSTRIGTAMVVGLVAATLTAHVAGAAPMTHHRHYQASAQQGGRSAHASPVNYGYAAPAPLQDNSIGGARGSFKDRISAP